MDKYIFDESNGLWYELIGDYYFPCLTVPAEEKQPVGIWGQRHLRYIREYRKARYTSLLLGGSLNSYLADIDQQAQERLDIIIRQMAQAQGITETLRTCIHNLKRRVDGSFSAILRCVFLQYTKYSYENAPCLAEKSLVHPTSSAVNTDSESYRPNGMGWQGK